MVAIIKHLSPIRQHQELGATLTMRFIVLETQNILFQCIQSHIILIKAMMFMKTVLPIENYSN